MISEVDHILCGNDIKAADLAVGILLYLSILIILISICRHIEIHGIIVHQRKGIRAVMLLDDGVIVLYPFAALCERNVLKDLGIIHLLFLLFIVDHIFRTALCGIIALFFRHGSCCLLHCGATPAAG